ncbi:hypothetical protein LCGC14_1507160 [marine sediment metagenome]|uniref:Uncharacterized protein n=1 Tax=marine sediment metagenome TaxID=412755 RepID=A0A0F9LHV8_9ZZZZ
MKAKEYQLLQRCVEEAVPHVWRRAFKHHPDPPVYTESIGEHLEAAIVHEVMDGICEWFVFDDVAIEDV